MRFPATLEWLRTHARLSPSLLESSTVVRSIAERAQALRVEAGWPEAELDRHYARRLDEDPAEAARARAIVSVPETWLFRGEASFEMLRERLRLRRRGIAQSVSMLSAGCANGAEPMSMALTAIDAGFAPRQVSIDAVDVNAEAMRSLAHGTFAGFAAREGLPPWVADAAVGADRSVTLPDSVLRMVRFVEADLFSWDPGPERYDAIFCRNVLIYLDADARVELLERLRLWLREDGVLVLGHAEAAETPKGFRAVDPVEAFAFERGEIVARPLLAPVERERRAAPRQRTTAREAPDRTPRPQRPERASLDLCRRLVAEAAWERGDAALRELLRREPDSVEAHRLLAETLLRRDRPREAEESLRRAVYLDPRCEAALIALAALAEGSGRRAMADRYRERALSAHLERDPDGPRR